MTDRHELEHQARDEILDAYAALCPGIIGNPYLGGHFPLPMQWHFLRGHLDRPESAGPEVYQALYGGSAGGGKLSPMDSPVLTPKGWRPIGDLEVGDAVTDPTTGGSCRVIAVHPQGSRDIYKITTDDGASIEVGLEHLWAYKRCGRVGRRPGTKASTQREYAADNLGTEPRTGDRWATLRVGDTGELLELLERGEQPRVPLTEPVLFTVNGRTGTGLPPYFVGLYLGDGCRNGTVTTVDPEIRDYLLELGCSQHAEPDSFGIVGDLAKQWRQWVRNNKLGACRSWEKFIPAYVQTAPIDYRLEVLRGLMDTDGTVDTRGRCYYTSTSRQLAEDVRDLVRGLGGKARVRERITRYTLHGERLEGRPSYTVRVWMRKTSAVFRLPRKRERCLDRWNGGAELMRAVVSIEKTRRAEAVCITVSNPAGLYVGEGHIVTHNSDALLMAAAQYVDRGDYAGILFRRTYTDLALPGAILDRALDWWKGKPGVHYDGTNKTFRFPSGAKITFAYLQHEGDERRYQGAEFQFSAWDELTQFPDRRPYRYVGLSRIRRSTTSDVPLRTLSATNPGGPGHPWVAEDFDVMLDGNGFDFFPARVVDNPYIDRDAYIAGLEHLHPTTREQLLRGDWRAREPGDYFRLEWFGPLLEERDAWPAADCRRVRWWDLAASVSEGAAHTAGVKMARHRSGVYAVEHCASFKATPGQRDARIVAVARGDGRTVTVGLEIEPGSGGVAQVESIAEKLKVHGIKCVYARPRAELDDRERVYVVRAPSSSNSKAARCDPVAACLERGYSRRGEGPEIDHYTGTRVPWWGEDAAKPVTEQRDGIRLIAGTWTQAYLDIVEGFPGDGTQRVDEADATSGAWSWLKAHPVGAQRALQPRTKTLSIDSDEYRRTNPSERPPLIEPGKDRAGRWRP